METISDNEIDYYRPDNEHNINISSINLFTNQTDLPSQLATAVGSAVMIAFFVEGLLGTVWIIVALLRKTDIRKSIVNVFVVSLCFNDLCSLLFVFDFIIDSYVWRRWHAGDLLCRLNPELTVAFTGCTFWHTALIAIHRYLVVVHVDAYRRISKRAYTAFVLVAARVIPSACILPALIDVGGFSSAGGGGGGAEGSVGYVPKLMRCVMLPDQRVRIMLVTTVLTIVPCVIVVLCYTGVLLFVSAAACRLKNQAVRRELRVTMIFVAIFLVVVGGFAPYTVVRSRDPGYAFDADVYVAVTVFYGVATCSTPLVYGALSTQIRQACSEVLRDWTVALRRACRCGRGRRQRDEAAVTAAAAGPVRTVLAPRTDAEVVGGGGHDGKLMLKAVVETRPVFSPDVAMPTPETNV